jgi:hypothetical protein
MLIIAAICVATGVLSPLAAVSAFAVGAVSDLLLNLIFNRARIRGPRTFYIRQYFDRVGTFTAMVFGGAITVSMTMLTIALTSLFGLQTASVGVTGDVVLGDGLAVCALGFVAGAAFFPAQYSKAGRELLPFYSNTSGFIENRIWDGASEVWAMVWVQAAAVVAGIVAGKVAVDRAR